MVVQSGKAFSIQINSQQANQPAGNFSIPVAPGLGEILSKGFWRVSLVWYQCWYAVQNISSALGNNQFYYTDTSGSYTITLPDGGWGVQQICDYINQQIVINNPGTPQIVLSPFLTTSTQIVISNAGASVNFGHNSATGKLAVILGFNATDNLSGIGSYVAPNDANIVSINSFYISFPGLVNSSFSQAITSQGTISSSSVLYQDSFNVQFNARQVVAIQNPLPIPLVCKNISTIQCMITDVNGAVIDFFQNGNYSNNPSAFTLLFEQSAEADGDHGHW